LSVVQHQILRSQVRTGSFVILDAFDWPFPERQLQVADWSKLPLLLARNASGKIDLLLTEQVASDNSDA